MRRRRLAAALAAVAIAAGSAVLLTNGSATAAETIRLEKEQTIYCNPTLPGLPEVRGYSAMYVRMDVPASGVVGQRSAPIPWQASGVLQFDLSEGSVLRTAFEQEGATSYLTEYEARFFLNEGYRELVRLRFSGETELSTGQARASGSGELPGLLPTGAGRDRVAIASNYHSVQITPRKADGSPTSYGTIQVMCVHSPDIPAWYWYDVVAAPTSTEHVVTARTETAGGATDLGAGSLTLTKGAAGAVTGELALPQTGTAAPPLLGVIPAAAEVLLTPGPVTGTATGLTAPVTVTIPGLAVLGFPLFKDKTTCTATTTLTLTPEAGFTVVGGGTLTGRYDLPAFTGCGAFTPLVTSLFSHPGNTVAITTS
ncbi:hypothetical protein [Actinokineospora pegani]|uniref:hypothetical protein n=1 Tax=Actinokineospora pegani TaxID=2654637 RepID=UPI0012E9BE4E|nr:hypothetical protein [Actinokineospora pegani]